MPQCGMRLNASIGIVLALIGLGCGKKEDSPLVGTWTSDGTIMKADSHTETRFNSDGTFKTVFNAMRKEGQGGIIATDTGTWALKGDQLTEHVLDIDWQFAGFSEAATQRARERFLKNKATLLKKDNEHATVTIKWDGHDKYSYTQEGQTYAYERKK